MNQTNSLLLKRLGIDTYKEAVVYTRSDCNICRAEGFKAHARVKVTLKEKSIIATLNTINSNLLGCNEAGLSEQAMYLLNAKEDDYITISHPKPINSLSHLRTKIYGNKLSKIQIAEIIQDITAGYYSDIHISSFLTACAGGRMDIDETVYLTEAMVAVGNKLTWDAKIVVDKHCVGGLPGNRTTPIIVAIVTAFGLTMPKTSSRAITSPAGTADTMEVFTNVELDLKQIRDVVKKENGCIIWGGSISLSPADDLLILVEKSLDLDSEAQLVASILSKKIAAGSNHVLIDIPIGPTAKVRSKENAEILKNCLETVGQKLGIIVKVIFSDGMEPVGRGIGPSLEAEDIIAVLQNKDNAPKDLEERALTLAGHIIEFSSQVNIGDGQKIAKDILKSGKAWEKFKAICEAQGGMKEIYQANYTHDHLAKKSGVISEIDNRRLALIAKLAGAPTNKVAGIYLNVHIGNNIKKNDVLFTIHAGSKGEMEYALNYLNEGNEVIKIS